MKRNILSYILLVLATTPATAQKEIQAEGNGENDFFDWNNVEEVRYGKENQFIDLKLSVDDIKKITFSLKDEVDLNKEDKAVTGNKLERVYLTSEANEGRILADVEGTKDGNTFSLFVPYLTDFSSLSLSFSTKGKVYVENALQKSGITQQDLSKGITYKVLASSGEVDTYTIKVFNSGLPVLKITTTDEESVSSNWSTTCGIEIRKADNKEDFSGELSVKYKGGKYSQAVKRSISLKLSKKNSLLGMSKGKRWSLQANNDDKTLLRNRIGSFMSSTWTELNWTPASQPVELIVNGEHKGNYLLTEDIRVGDGRVKDGTVLEVTEDVDETDIHFTSKESKLTFKLVDPDDVNITSIAQSIENFEKALYGSNFKNANNGYRSLIDVNSFVDWYLINEICRNEEAGFDANCYVNINADGKILMGPIYNMEDYIGNGNASTEGFVIRGEGWFKRLFQDPYFVGLVAKRFDEMKGNLSGVSSELESMKKEILLSFYSNESLWDCNGKATASDSEKEKAQDQEISSVNKWLEERIKWLSIRYENDAKTAQEDKNGNNQINEFSISKDNNRDALFTDYKGTISGNGIDVYVPYLVHFDLAAKFSVSSGAKVYVNGEEITSGSTKVNYVNPVEMKVVSSSGDVRTYNVNIHNSGLPVLYLNTPNAKGITSKTEWIDKTEMTMYNKDGSINYDSGEDKVQVKGRGNSTWDASDKKPYAIRQNKKTEVLGMLEHKRWVLMANYYDATFLRNEMANFLAKRYTTADWAPSGFNIELVLNGKHVGNYYFCEQAKINDARVPGQYLVEADYKVKSTGGGMFNMWGNNSGNDDPGYQFEGEKSKNVFNVKHPEVPDNSQELQYVKGKINDLENALYGGNWNKVKELIDLPSFADWYVIKELSKDYDGNMFTSCYCHIMEDGIIRMGPVWDFDLAFGGNPFEDMFGGGGGMWNMGGGGTDYAWYNEPQDYYIGAKEQATGTNWFLKFFEQKEFLKLVKERIDWMVEDMDVIMDYIDQKGKEVELSATVSQSRNGGGGGGGMWNMGGQSSGSSVTIQQYQDEIKVMKDFIKNRLLWIQEDLRKRNL